MVLVILLITAITIFSFQNATPVVVAFLSWRFESSLAIVALVSLLAGLLIRIVIVAWNAMKHAVRAKSTRGEGVKGGA